ncbi:MAG: anti-sigma factor [Dehalococcoidia bacterium]|nr:anti-sigma factor [Dehalococcoidia bacterium]
MFAYPASPATFALVEGLPSLPEGKAYQAWFTPDGETFEPSDVFRESRGGVWLSASQDMGQYAAAAFTIEDEDGAEAPTQDPFVVIPFGATAAATAQGEP